MTMPALLGSLGSTSPLGLMAQQPGAGQQPSMLPTLVMFGLLLVIFYFFLILPQRRKQKAHQAMLDALVPGDRVVTTGGIVGTVIKAENTTVRLKIAPSVEINVLKGYVAGKSGEETA